MVIIAKLPVSQPQQPHVPPVTSVSASNLQEPLILVQLDLPAQVAQWNKFHASQGTSKLPLPKALVPNVQLQIIACIAQLQALQLKPHVQRGTGVQILEWIAQFHVLQRSIKIKLVKLAARAVWTGTTAIVQE